MPHLCSLPETSCLSHPSDPSILRVSYYNMARFLWSHLSILLMLGCAFAVPAFHRIAGNASVNIGLALRQDDESILSDLGITKLAAVGDSYSAGIGAGDRL